MRKRRNSAKYCLKETKLKTTNDEKTAEQTDSQNLNPVEEINADAQTAQDNNTETTTAETVNSEQSETSSLEAGSTDPKIAIATLLEAEVLLQKGELTNAFEK